MKIFRDGKEYELTLQELIQAHEEVSIGFMATELHNSFGLDKNTAREVARKAFEKYAEGTGKTEYECIEWAYNQYIENFPKESRQVLVSDILWDVDEVDESTLPKEVVLPLDLAKENFESQEEWLYAITNWLSEEYGMAVISFVANDEH